LEAEEEEEEEEEEELSCLTLGGGGGREMREETPCAGGGRAEEEPAFSRVEEEEEEVDLEDSLSGFMTLPDDLDEALLLLCLLVAWEDEESFALLLFETSPSTALSDLFERTRSFIFPL